MRSRPECSKVGQTILEINARAPGGGEVAAMSGLRGMKT